MKVTATCLSVVIAAVGLAIAAPSAAEDGPQAKVGATKHNLTSRGPGPVKVAGKAQVCSFCHTPHAASPLAPLWNRDDPGAYYQPYTSTTLVSRVGQPTGSSRLCLSCHDGTIALAQTHNSRNMPSSSVRISARDRGYIGTDLRNDHPISFLYSAALAAERGQLLPPSSLPHALQLDDGKQLQCTTCHDPHNNQFGAFLTMNNAQAAMCRTCHVLRGWDLSAHARSNASLAGSRVGVWDNIQASTVREASCEACHRPHGAGGRQRLLRREAEEDNCLDCHDGSVAAKNIAADLTKLSTHPVGSTTGAHDPLESSSAMPRHVECSDCHDAHRVRSGGSANAPLIKPAMQGARGIGDGSRRRVGATYEYEVCYRCHAGTGTVRSPLVDRVIVDTDVSSEFAPSNPSFHPVQTQGKNHDVPSLAPSLRVSSMIYCTDCHSSDASATGAQGPHGSRYRPLLVRRYETLDRTVESPQAYALCYGCHNRSSILGDRSFPLHKKHIVEEKAPCSACHDAHGVSAGKVGATGGTHLINFDRRIVRPTSTGAGPTFVDSGVRGRGACTLTCHGEAHVNEAYPEDDD